MNKTLLKIASLFFFFGIVDVLVILYWWLRCGQTQSSFYCDSFAFGGIFLVLGIPGLILFGGSLIALVFSKFYKGNISRFLKFFLVILGIIIFVGPYSPYLFSSDNPKTYGEFLQKAEVRKLESQTKEEQKCVEYKKRMSQWNEGDPMPTPPSKNCN